MDLQIADNCWICEGWTQVTFEFHPKNEGIEHVYAHTPVHLHCELDEFKGDLMLPDPENPDRYVTTRMVPPGKEFGFFFSIAGK